MDGNVKGLVRPALVPVVAALTGIRESAWTFDRRRIVGTTEDGVAWATPGADWFRDGRVWSVTDPREAMELLDTRGLTPPNDERRAFTCAMCGGATTVPAAVGTARVYCPGCIEQCVTCGGTGSVTTTGDGSHGTLEPATCDDCDAGYRSHTSTGHTSHPGTISDLVAWASLGSAAITRAEAIALHGAHLLTLRPACVVWRIAPTTPFPKDAMTWQWERQRTNAGAGVSAPCDELYAMGVLWLWGDDDVIVLCVPPLDSESRARAAGER